MVARHASRGADSKLSNAVDDGIFDHVFSQFSSSFVVEYFIADDHERG